MFNRTSTLFLFAVVSAAILPSCGKSPLDQIVDTDLQDDDIQKKVNGIYRLATLKEESSEIAAVLVSYLSAPEPAVRLAALQSLGGLKSEADLVNPKLLEVARQDSDPKLRCEAMRMLNVFAPNDSVATEILETCLDDPNFEIARCAADCLISREVEISSDSLQAIAVCFSTSIKNAVKSGDESMVARELADGLGRMGPRAAEVLPSIRPTMKLRPMTPGVRTLVRNTVRALEGM